MATYRHQAPVLNPVTSLTVDQHTEIKRLALESALDWSTSEGAYGSLITKFRFEVKEHYYRWQRRRCCYCSSELQRHKISYDAEHILDKSEYPEYVFDEANLAVACKLCNQYKSNRSISVGGARFAILSRNQGDYSIVHPHLDDWSVHLKFDSVGRIVARVGSSKGRETIRICGMASLNAARLADEFAIEDTEEAESALRAFHEVRDVARKREFVELLSLMADRYEHPGSRAVVDALEADVKEQEAGLVDSDALFNALNAGFAGLAAIQNASEPQQPGQGLAPHLGFTPAALLPPPSGQAET